MGYRETIRDDHGRIIGYIEDAPNNQQKATDRNGHTLGYFDGRKTTDRNGRTLGSGDLLMHLIYDACD